ncbi:MAG: hypothetical protein ACXWQO_18355, partial [Bdellovibrionota bacterium]
SIPKAECEAEKGKWSDEGNGYCLIVGTNRIEITRPEGEKNYQVSFGIIGSTGNLCDAQVEMKADGSALKLVNGLDEPSKEYRLSLQLKGDEIEVKEKLGKEEQEANHSPGCGVNAFLSGNKHKFERN